MQTAKFVLFLYEYPNAIRFVPTDGRPHEVDPDPTWMGSSVGRWDGDTLVVDAIGFNDKTEVHGFMHTDALHVVERFRRLENGSLQYDVTVEDPNLWQTPWVIPARTFPRRPELEMMVEGVGLRDLPTASSTTQAETHRDAVPRPPGPRAAGRGERCGHASSVACVTHRSRGRDAR